MRRFNGTFKDLLIFSEASALRDVPLAPGIRIRHGACDDLIFCVSTFQGSDDGLIRAFDLSHFRSTVFGCEVL